MDRLEEIEAEMKALEEARNVLAEERQRLLDERAGIAVGDIVVDTQWGTARRGQVTRIRHCLRGKSWVYVRLFKKDGSLSQRETCFYSNWEKEA